MSARMLVQIFEVQTPEEAAALAGLGVDHIGVLVGDGAFPRELSIARTSAIFTAVPAGKKRVALSLSANLEEVIRVVAETRPDIVQVQAEIDFSVAMTRVLKMRYPQIPIMRAIPVILAGGLGPENVAAAIAAVRPAGVDSKTKTDRPNGGSKDLAKVEAFVAAATLTR